MSKHPIHDMIEEAISEKDIPVHPEAVFYYAKFKCGKPIVVADLRKRKKIMPILHRKSFDAYNFALRANEKAASEVADHIDKSLAVMNIWKVNIRINTLHLLVWKTKENLQRIAKLYAKEIKQHEKNGIIH